MIDFFHIISLGGGVSGLEGKFIFNLRNGDVLFGGVASPLSMPLAYNGINFSANANVGWVTNLEYSDRYNNSGEKILGDRITSLLSGAGEGVSVCYIGCLSGGRSLSSSGNKTYYNIELGAGYGGSVGSFSQGYYDYIYKGDK